jgi:hypothetical protein
MLSKLISLIGVTAVFAELRNNDVDTRYFVTQFNGREFPMVLGTCNPLSVLGTYYQMAVCKDENKVKWTLYTDDECTAQIPTQTLYFDSSDQTGVGTFGDFNCDEDKIDAYTSIEFGIGTCDTTSKVTYSAAVGTCILDTELGESDVEDYQSLRVYCSDTIAELQYFDFDDYNGTYFGASCTEELLYQTRNATTECGYMLTSSGDDGDTDIYGEIIDCVLNATLDVYEPSTVMPTDADTTAGPTDGETEDGDDSSSNILSISFAFISIIISLCNM